MFSNKQKVYTTDSRPITSSEDVGIEGKHYPTNILGRVLARHPWKMFLTVLLPFAFFVIGCMRVKDHMNYSLDDFRLRSDVQVRKDAETHQKALNAWTEALSDDEFLSMQLNKKSPRSIVEDSLELRVTVDTLAVKQYLERRGLSFAEHGRAYSNLLHPFCTEYINDVERRLQFLYSFHDVCFTNDLEYGYPNSQFGGADYKLPNCVPRSTMMQFIYPVFSMTQGRWHMDAEGTIPENNYTKRIVQNPNHLWFVDSNFSSSNPHVSVMRSQYLMASSHTQPRKDFEAKRLAFVSEASLVLKYISTHPYLRIMIGGDTVESVKIEDKARAEAYKVGVATVICLVFSVVHCGTLLMGLYTATQVIITYFAALGVFSLIYETVPLMSFSAVVWVMTFGMHATLSFYDMFVFTGVMATKGRQNNLSVAQRVCFTIRRVSVGVLLANVLGVAIFAINTTSVFESVRQFSILMILAFMWNMYFILLPTPALVLAHHFTFSGKRRNLQKQTDVLNDRRRELKRSPAMVEVLQAAHSNPMPGEEPFQMTEAMEMERLGVDRSARPQQTRGLTGIIRRELVIGQSKFRAAHYDIVGALHKARKTKRTFIDGEDVRPREMPAFCVDDFMDVGPANPLGPGEEKEAVTRRYYNARMVPAAELLHVDRALVERSGGCWAAMGAAADGAVLCARADGSSAPTVAPLGKADEQQGDRAAQRKLTGGWAAVASQMALEVPDRQRWVVPVVARAIARAQDSRYVVDGSGAAASDGTPSEESPGRSARFVDPGNAGLGLRKMRYLWKHRNESERSGCCGLWGRRVDETPEVRMRRLMNRQVKREGYTFFERLIIQYYVPAIHYLRYALLVMFFVLFVVVCAVGARIESLGLPTTLVTDDGGTSLAFAKLDDAFGQRGRCTFCSPYYSNYNLTSTASLAVIQKCGPGQIRMSDYIDSCGECNGNNTCLDCALTANGGHITTRCGGCEKDESTCECSATHECSICEWAPEEAKDCSTVCTEETCGPRGRCNAFTGKCDCDADFTGDACDACVPWRAPIAANPQCTAECVESSGDCTCDVWRGVCSGCPAGKRGPTCSQNLLDCKNGGTFDAATSLCTCPEGFSGTECEQDDRCSGRGTWLDAAQSPTGVATCACRGHWRGPTCQLCDCLNGGMCDAVTGACNCVGAFTGARCHFCDATCVAHGSCPVDVPVRPDKWNIRTCIQEKCNAEERAAEVTCSACQVNTVGTTTCRAQKTKSSCNLLGSCWWMPAESGSEAGTCTSATPQYPISASSYMCSCTNPNVWGGATCSICRGGYGTTCTGRETIVGCNGITYTDAALAPVMDYCGVCQGDGLCRGCDGIIGSGLVYDNCGICGGDNTCEDAEYFRPPLQIDYFVDLTNVKDMESDMYWVRQLSNFCLAARVMDSVNAKRCFIEDYMKSRNDNTIGTIREVYEYARANGRFGEVGFDMDINTYLPTKWRYMNYRLNSNLPDNAGTYTLYDHRVYLEERLIEPYNEYALQYYGMKALITTRNFQDSAAAVLSGQSLWFAVGIGMALTFVVLLVYYVSFTIAGGVAFVAGIVCFGTLTVSSFMNWRLDAMLQVCISCTIPIGVEYVVHLSNGYFDYLQTTTSHLFAREVTRRTAVQGAFLRSLPSICTSVVAVVVSCIMFDVSELLPSKRTGQVCITMHLILIIAVVLFSGGVAAVGPMTSYKHWTVSTVLCLACGVGAAVSVAIIYALDGVTSPTGEKLLSRKKKYQL